MRRSILLLALVAVAVLAPACSSLFPFAQDTAGTREDAPRFATNITVNDSPTNAYGSSQSGTEAAAIGGEEGSRSGTATPSGSSTPTVSPSLVEPEAKKKPLAICSSTMSVKVSESGNGPGETTGPSGEP